MYVRYLKDFDGKVLQSPLAKSDMLVLGSGIAGLFVALKAAQQGLLVSLVTKSWEESNTKYAQGGIAAVLDLQHDSYEQHFADTVNAGAKLCNEEAVRIMVEEGPARVLELIELGTYFDRLENGSICFTREGGHHQKRVLHSYGDKTGLEIKKSLQEAVVAHPNITVLEDLFVLDLLTDKGQCYGILALDSSMKPVVLAGKCTVVATGGGGQLYSQTTNPKVATADGIAMAYRAGAELMNMEFVQFHPTALSLEGAPAFLISEAVRGEGGILRKLNGERFMPSYHQLAELAPRDVVAKAMVKEMEKDNSKHLYLDVTTLSNNTDFSERFPTIYQTLSQHGINCKVDYIPVAPAAHYFMGGVRVDYHGRTSILGLYACGEVACCGLHGANRLASNSLLDALVFGHRVATAAYQWCVGKTCVGKTCVDKQLAMGSLGYHIQRTQPKLSFLEVKNQLQRIMWRKAGLVRSHNSLLSGLQGLGKLSPFTYQQNTTPAEFEVVNLLMVGSLLLRAALWREESRGGHYRSDFPQMSIEWNVPSLLRR